MKASRLRALPLLSLCLCLATCSGSREPRSEASPVVVASVRRQAVTLTQQYICQIQAYHHIEVRAPEAGNVRVMPIATGQAVKQGDLLFQIGSLSADDDQTSQIDPRSIVIRAPFEGVISGLISQKGSFVRKGETLMSLLDDSRIQAEFNVPEARYLEYKSADLDERRDDLKIELVLEDGSRFDQPGRLAAIGADFDIQTGSVKFLADFPNPQRLLRHGQTGAVQISRVQKDTIVIPQRATFEKDQRRYVYVVDQDDVAHQREIVVQHEVQDEFVIDSGVAVDDSIVVEGVRLVRDGEKLKSADHHLNDATAKVKAHVKSPGVPAVRC